MAVATVFRALGDSTRLEMVQRLSRDTSYTINTVSSQLGITRQGARKHLQVLADANLVTLEPVGRDVHVTLNRKQLDQAKEFILKIERQWDVRLEALRSFVDTE